MSWDGEMLWSGFTFELARNGGGLCLTFFSENGDRLASSFFSDTRELEEDIELLDEQGEAVGMVRDRAPQGLLKELREV